MHGPSMAQTSTSEAKLLPVAHIIMHVTRNGEYPSPFMTLEDKGNTPPLFAGGMFCLCAFKLSCLSYRLRERCLRFFGKYVSLVQVRLNAYSLSPVMFNTNDGC